MTKTLKLTIFVCGILLVVILGSALLDVSVVFSFNRWVRPFIFAGLAVCVWLAMGRGARARKSYVSNLTVVLSIVLYVVVIFGVSYFFGGGRNVMTPNINTVFVSFWTMGVPLISGELIRYRLLKQTGRRERTAVFVIVTIVFAMLYITDLGSALAGTANWVNFGFASVLPAFAISVLLSFMAIEGSAVSVVLISFIYNLGGVFSPVLPNVERLPWALLICIQVFIVGMVYYRLADESNSAQRKRIARSARISKGPMGTILSLGFGAVMIAFFLQLLPLYPVVILTGSMSGSIERGSLVVMRRIPSHQVFEDVELGLVLHYRSGNMEFVHRVVDFHYTDQGVREFVTQGDANPVPDAELLVQEDVIGTPMFIFPFIGYPNIFIRAIFGGII